MAAAERRLNFGLRSAESRKKHTPQPSQFGGAPALVVHFGQCFRLPYRL